MTQTIAESPTRANGNGRASDKIGKYLAFHLGPEEFGIEVMKVREIIGIQEITAVPHTPGYVKGVINLRGKVIPVLDLRCKLGLPPVEQTQCTCIMVVQIETAGGPLLTGVVVDGVSEVLTIGAADIEPAPDFGREVTVYHVLGIAKVRGHVKILLDITEILTPDEAKTISQTAAMN